MNILNENYFKVEFILLFNEFSLFYASMKIGILSLPFNNNYGGLLQAYALQSYLIGRGHDVFLINQPFFTTKFRIKNSIKKLSRLSNYISFENFDNFRHKHLHETIPLNSNKDFTKLYRYKFDAVITGSDQVWRFNYIKDNYKRYFLDFVDNDKVIKISYAASFGVDYWEANETITRNVTHLIKKFDGVSVREIEGIRFCRDCLNYHNVIKLLDPTLLMPPDFYRQLYNGKEKGNEGKIGCYFLDSDPQKLSLVAYLEKHFNLQSFIIGKKSNSNNSIIFYPPISQWIKDFDTAEYIITDSYHGMIFSIIFQKPFIVFGNKERGLVRFSSLLYHFGLKERLIDIVESSKHSFSEYSSAIDCSLFNEKLSANLNQSDLFLKSVGL